jgi:cell division protein FtsZ
MGSGYGEGEDRAQEAAQEAISSPLLDEVSIKGARGVLINITGGMDLAIDEVHKISTIIHDEVGDDTEIIFGMVHDKKLKGQVRVTVIATGFDDVIQAEPAEFIRSVEISDIAVNQSRPQVQRPVRVLATGGENTEGLEHQGSMPTVVPLTPLNESIITHQEIGELDVPTFIRRQMD